MPGRLDFSFLLGGQPPRDSRREPEAAFRIVVLGDFSGRDDGPPTRTHRIDLDNFDEVFARLQPRCRLSFGSKVTELTFRDFDALHPDALLADMPTLAAVRAEAKAVRDPARAAAVRGALAPPPAPPAPGPEASSPFEQLLGRPREAARAQPAGLDAWIAQMVRPHLAATVDPRNVDIAASLDAASAALLRELLHHPAFQRRETVWRGLRWLLQNLECDETLLVDVLDASPQALAAATAGDDLKTSPLHRLLVDRAGAGATAVTLVVVLQAFGPDETDVCTLAALGALGQRGGFAVAATGTSALLGARTWPTAGDPATWQLPAASAATWQALRTSPQATRLALVAPRFLLRLPYGQGTEPIDAFRFEEMPGPDRHEDYLWGDGGLAVAQLLGTAFRAGGWQLDLSGHHEVERLPLHTRKVDGRVTMQPCAEVLLTERGVAAAAATGLSVLQSHADRDAARLVRLRSLAPGDADLAGPWCR